MILALVTGSRTKWEKEFKTLTITQLSIDQHQTTWSFVGSWQSLSLSRHKLIQSYLNLFHIAKCEVPAPHMKTHIVIIVIKIYSN